MGKPDLNSAKIKLTMHILEELKGPPKLDYIGFPRTELAEYAGITEQKVDTFLREVCRGMFESRKGIIIPLYDDFGGRDNFLILMGEQIRTVRTPNYIEGRGKEYGKSESQLHQASFAYSRGKRS